MRANQRSTKSLNIALFPATMRSTRWCCSIESTNTIFSGLSLYSGYIPFGKI
nr:MAG TPA: hypothetical protein [Caudoviricetes sp.]